jgi:hypothetical protein
MRSSHRLIAAIAAVALALSGPAASEATAHYVAGGRAQGTTTLPTVLVRDVLSTLAVAQAALRRMKTVVAYAEGAYRLASQASSTARRALVLARPSETIAKAVTSATVGSGSSSPALLAACPAGHRALGGGGVPPTTGSDVPIVASYPTADGSAWAVVWQNSSGSEIDNGSWTVYALCLPTG